VSSTWLLVAMPEYSSTTNEPDPDGNEAVIVTVVPATLGALPMAIRSVSADVACLSMFQVFTPSEKLVATVLPASTATSMLPAAGVIVRVSDVPLPVLVTAVA
jgi:uncharacterized membrane protein